MNIERLPYLLARYYEGVLNSSEWEELKSLMDRDDLVQFIAEDLDKTYPLPIPLKWDKASIEQVWRKIDPARKNVSPIHRIHFLKTSWFRYAAAVILIAGAAVVGVLTTRHKPGQTLAGDNKHLQTDIQSGRDRAVLTLANGQQIILDSTQGNIVKQGSLTVVNLAGKLKYEGVGTNADYNTISTPKGGQYRIVLPDGSRVWLNAASSIKFPTAFSGTTRMVEMTGEAYLEVAQNPKQSFIVKTNTAEIQVLGTSFNVNAYEDENAIKTTLIEGGVKVVFNSKFNSQSNSKAGSSSIILKPGQQAQLIQQQLSVVNNADIEQVLAWKNGAFLFKHTSLAVAMRQLARWYDIEVMYEKGVPDIKLSGDMKRDLSFSQMLDALSELGVKFRIGGRRLVIMQ